MPRSPCGGEDVYPFAERLRTRDVKTRICIVVGRPIGFQGTFVEWRNYYPEYFIAAPQAASRQIAGDGRRPLSHQGRGHVWECCSAASLGSECDCALQTQARGLESHLLVMSSLVTFQGRRQHVQEGE